MHQGPRGSEVNASSNTQWKKLRIDHESRLGKIIDQEPSWTKRFKGSIIKDLEDEEESMNMELEEANNETSRRGYEPIIMDLEVEAS